MTRRRLLRRLGRGAAGGAAGGFLRSPRGSVLASPAPPGARAEFVRQNGQLTVREGVLKGPMIGGTIEGTIDFPADQVRMSGTFVPMYGLNNIFGQIPVVGILLGAGNNEGLIGVTYQIIG